MHINLLNSVIFSKILLLKGGKHTSQFWKLRKVLMISFWRWQSFNYNESLFFSRCRSIVAWHETLSDAGLSDTGVGWVGVFGVPRFWQIRAITLLVAPPSPLRIFRPSYGPEIYQMEMSCTLGEICNWGHSKMTFFFITPTGILIIFILYNLFVTSKKWNHEFTNS